MVFAPGNDVPATEPGAMSVTARWLVLTTDVSHGFARALLPAPFGLPDRPQLAVWIVEPLSADSEALGVPAGRLFAGMSCRCRLPGAPGESAYTPDFLIGSPIDDGDRDPFALPNLPQADLSLVNRVDGMRFSIPPVAGDGRGVVGRVDLTECGSPRARLTPDWLGRQAWSTDAVADGGAADLVHTCWRVTRLSPIISGSAVVECAEFDAHTYDLSETGALDARYGFARVTILDRR